jgi:hypothetical protein
VQVGHQHLGHGQAVVGCLAGDLLQPIDTAQPHLGPVAAELVDRAGEPLAGLALAGQLLGGGGLLAVGGELLEGQNGAGQHGQPGDGLQRRGAQVVLELQTRIAQRQPVTGLKRFQRLGGQGWGEPAREHQNPGGQQPDGGRQPNGQQGVAQSDGSGQPAEPGSDEDPKLDAAGWLGPAAPGGRTGHHGEGHRASQGPNPHGLQEPPGERLGRPTQGVLPPGDAGGPQQRDHPQHGELAAMWAVGREHQPAEHIQPHPEPAGGGEHHEGDPDQDRPDPEGVGDAAGHPRDQLVVGAADEPASRSRTAGGRRCGLGLSLWCRALIHRVADQQIAGDQRSVLDLAAGGNHCPHSTLAWHVRLVGGLDGPQQLGLDGTA